MAPALVAVGAVLRAHGVRGELRVRAFDPASRALRDGASVHVGDAVFTIESAARSGPDWLVKLRGLDDRSLAEGLRGQRLAVARAELPAPAPGEVYLADLVGCHVQTVDGAAIGTVVAVESHPAQDLLVVETATGATTLLPFVEPIVVHVDVEARRLVCEPPEGLLELALDPAVGSHARRRGRR